MLSGILRLRKVDDVTSAKDEPAPVYLLDELVKATQTSPEDAQHIVEHLLKKLESKNPIIKAKSLRACKYLVQKGARDAHRILQRNAGPIRQLQNYKGVTDPMKGDALNERVRNAAKETMTIVYSADAAAATTNSLSNQSRIQGFGSQSGGGLAVGGSDMAPKMAGFGSERFAGMGSERGNNFSVQPSYRQSSAPLPATSRQTTSFLSENQKADSEHDRGHSQSSHGPASVVGDEEELVNSICHPGGVRSAPAAEDLRRFIDTAGTLSGPRIAKKLQEKLTSGNWQECYRALCAIETVILKGSNISCGEIGVHFQSDLNIIRQCLKSTQSSVRSRAQKILDIFKEVDDEEDKDPVPAPAEETPPLIDGVMEDTPNDTHAQTRPPSVLDLLDGNVGGSVAEPVGKGDVFGGLEVTTEPVKNPPQTANGTSNGAGDMSDMFSGLAVSGNNAPAGSGNVHLDALLAPAPASDPFPETHTPLKAESDEPAPLQQLPGGIPPQQPPAGAPPQFAMQGQGMMPSFPAAQAPMMTAGAFQPQMNMFTPQQQGGMPFMNMAQMQPGMAPVGYAPPMMNPYGQGFPPGAAHQQAPLFQMNESGNRQEVPLSAFTGPAHIQRRNSSGKGGNSAFSFVGDHMSQLREKK